MSKLYVQDNKFDDLVSTESFLSEINAPSSTECALVCESMEHCKSFFYNKNNAECKLESTRIETTSKTTNYNGMKYFIDKLGMCFNLTIVPFLSK